MSTNHFKVLILGAGSGGVSVAARLKKSVGAQNIGMIEPSENHFYQPLWTLVGAGLVQKEKTKKAMSSIIPKGVNWIKDHVKTVDAVKQKVICVSGKEFTYDHLLVAANAQMGKRWRN